MLNNSVVSFYGNFGLILKGSEDKATNGIENWSLPTTQLAPSHATIVANITESLYHQKLESPTNISVADSMGVSLFIFT